MLKFADLVLQQALIVAQEPVLFLLSDQEPQSDDQLSPLLEDETQDDENSTIGIVSEKVLVYLPLKF